MVPSLLSLRYITSAYWAIATMTTVGYGDIAAVRIEEKIVACVIMMAGTSMFAYMMGSVVSGVALALHKVVTQQSLTRRPTMLYSLVWCPN